MKKVSVKTALGAVADSVGKKKDGTMVARRGFYYRHGFTAEKFEAAVTEALTAAGLKFEVTDRYEIWKPFNGGASVAAGSHWGVEFKVKEA